MCWICAKHSKFMLQYATADDGGLVHWSAAGDKLTAALTADGIGDIKADSLNQVLLVVTADTAGDGIGVAPGNPVITVSTPAAPVASTISTIDLPGDQDYYQVHLVAGQTYQIGMYAKVAGPGGVPLSDPYIEILTDNGTTDGFEVVSADGGAPSPQNQINSGLDVLLTFEPTVTGTYYINARAFGNAGGPNGDEVGDYELFVKDVTNDPSVYRPYYQPDEPLYAIDWGTQVNKVNQSARNPDGDEGTRDTGNAQGTPTYGSALDIPALAAAQGKDITGKNVITIYFAREGDVFVSEDPVNPGLPPATITSVAIQDFEYTAVWTSLAEFAKVADIVYLEVDNRDHADFIYTSYTGTPGPGVSLLGSMSPPDYYDEGLAQFNSGDERWNARDLAQGGFSFVTLIHEFGHGHGLAHPHDNGGHSGEMRGVEGTINTPAGQVPDPTGVWPNYTLGDHNLNQQVFTMMSYQDGWPTSPYGNAPTNAGYGYLGGLSPFDITAIQDKYGVNEDWATGDDTYTLKDVNAAGTFYTGIWDGGGTDEIVYSGARNATIDLRAATLAYEEGGGGRVSYAFGIYGGFTIANGVTIENAQTGSGNDSLTGNDAANRLDGGLGNDTLDGGLGIDTLIGGGGNDTYIVNSAGDAIFEAAGGGTDTVQSSITVTLAAEVENLTLTGTGAINGIGNALNNVMIGNSNANSLTGGAGNDTYYYDHLGDRAYDSSAVDGGVDIVFSSVTATLTTYVENLTLTGTANLTGVGNALNNTIIGNSGNNTLSGAAGADTMIGGDGNDIFIYDNLGDRAYDSSLSSGGIDTVQSAVTATLTTWVENLTLTGTGANTGVGNDLANTIIGNSANNQLAGMAGADILSGGGGNDTFVYHNAAHSTAAARDRINGFDLGDKINLSQIDANANTGANDAFTFIGAAAFSNTAGELRAYQSGADWFVEGDVNGDGVADLVIALTTAGGHAMAVGDFVL